MQMFPVRVSLDSPECEPFKKHSTDAGWDLKSNMEDFTLYKGAKVQVPTGVKFAIPKGQVGLIVPRSGLGTKYEVQLANTVGVIDADYRGEVLVTLTNKGNEDLKIHKYDRICQIMFVPVNVSKLRILSSLPDTKRGAGGFGSTGV